MGATEGAGEVQWTVERGGKYVFTHKSGDAEETATFVVNGPFTVRVPKSISHLTCAVFVDETPVGGNEDGQYVRYDIPGSGCTIVFTPTDGYLIRSGGELALPVRDKTLGVDDLPVLIAPGDKDNPWKVDAGGTDAVQAYVNEGVLGIVGSGAMDDFSDAARVPWTAVAGDVTAVTVGDGVTKIGKNALAGFADTVTVNGVQFSFYDMMAGARGFSEGGASPSGAISPAEFEQVQIVDGKAYLGVSVYTSDTITNQNWSVATNGVIEVPVLGKQGFFYLMSKPAAPSDARFISPILKIGNR